MPAPNAYKQCILAYKQECVYFVTSNDSGLIRPLKLIKISCNIHAPSITWLMFCSEIVFVILENFWETMVVILFENLVRFLKFQEISRKIGLLLFLQTWYAWTICYLACDCSYHDEKLHEWIVLHNTKNRFQSSFKLYMKWHTGNQKIVKIINWLSFIRSTSYYLV